MQLTPNGHFFHDQYTRIGPFDHTLEICFSDDRVTFCVDADCIEQTSKQPCKSTTSNYKRRVEASKNSRESCLGFICAQGVNDI